MARYSLYRHPDGLGYLLDVQAALQAQFNTRVVVPLLPRDSAPTPARELNPVFQIDGEPCVMVTQYMAALPVKVLKGALGNLEAKRADIDPAVDLLMQGF